MARAWTAARFSFSSATKIRSVSGQKPPMCQRGKIPIGSARAAISPPPVASMVKRVELMPSTT